MILKEVDVKEEILEKKNNTEEMKSGRNGDPKKDSGVADTFQDARKDNPSKKQSSKNTIIDKKDDKESEGQTCSANDTSAQIENKLEKFFSNKNLDYTLFCENAKGMDGKTIMKMLGINPSKKETSDDKSGDANVEAKKGTESGNATIQTKEGIVTDSANSNLGNCSVNMGNRVENKSPVKIALQTVSLSDKDDVIIEAEKSQSEDSKEDGISDDGGVYISDSDVCERLSAINRLKEMNLTEKEYNSGMKEIDKKFKEAKEKKAADAAAKKDEDEKEEGIGQMGKTPSEGNAGVTDATATGKAGEGEQNKTVHGAADGNVDSKLENDLIRSEQKIENIKTIVATVSKDKAKNQRGRQTARRGRCFNRGGGRGAGRSASEGSNVGCHGKGEEIKEKRSSSEGKVYRKKRRQLKDLENKVVCTSLDNIRHGFIKKNIQVEMKGKVI